MNRAILLFVVVAYAVSWTIAEVYYRLVGGSQAVRLIGAGVPRPDRLRDTGKSR